MLRLRHHLLFVLIISPVFLYGQETFEKSSIDVSIIDYHTNQTTPVRIRLINSKGYSAGLPNEVISIMYGRDDHPERYSYQPDSSFYVDGKFSLTIHPGEYKLILSKGLEYLDQTHNIEVNSGEVKKLNYQMERWINMADSGWFSADDHIHIRRSPRENPLILKWVEAEGLNVGILLQMGDFWATYFSQYAFGKAGVYKGDKSMLSTGQEEPRTHEIGHTIAMVADGFVRYRNEYYDYDKVFDEIHQLNGIMGYAHQGMSFNGFRGMTLDVLAGNVDFLELLQFCVEGGPLITQNYYHFLDLGYKITATAGSDFPWCGIGPLFGEEGPNWNARIGNVRFYTYVDDDFKYESWKESLMSGHTFVTSGPIVQLNVNGKIPGDELELSSPGKVIVSARAYGQKDDIPLSKLEIVAHGEVIKEITPGTKGQSTEMLNLDFDMDIKYGIWLAARCYAGPTQIAHTTPVYITVNNRGFQNDKTLNNYLALNEKYLGELENELAEPNESVNQRAWWYKKRLKERIQETREIIETLKSK